MTTTNPDDADHGRPEDRQLQCLLDTIVLPSAVVVANDRLCTLSQTEDRHGNEHRHAVDDANHGNRQVSSVDLQLIVQDRVHHAGRRQHGEHRRANGNNGQAERPPEPEISDMKLQQAAAAYEVAQYPDGRDRLRDDRRSCGTLHPPAKTEQEDRIEYRIERGTDQHGVHGHAGISLTTNDGVEPKADHLEHRAEHNDPQVVSRQRLALRTGPQQSQHRDRAESRQPP